MLYILHVHQGVMPYQRLTESGLGTCKTGIPIISLSFLPSFFLVVKLVEVWGQGGVGRRVWLHCDCSQKLGCGWKSCIAPKIISSTADKVVGITHCSFRDAALTLTPARHMLWAIWCVVIGAGCGVIGDFCLIFYFGTTPRGAWAYFWL